MVRPHRRNHHVEEHLSEIIAGGGGTTFYGKLGYEKVIRGSINIRTGLCPQPFSQLKEVSTMPEN
jgi:hypothetical protein